MCSVTELLSLIGSDGKLNTFGLPSLKQDCFCASRNLVTQSILCSKDHHACTSLLSCTNLFEILKLQSYNSIRESL